MSVDYMEQQKTSISGLSTVEVEYMALSQATQEAIWLQRLLGEVGESTKDGTMIMEDNQGAIATTQNPVFHRCTKHIQIRYHHVREAVAEGIVRLVYVKVQSEALAESSIVIGRVFGQQSG